MIRRFVIAGVGVGLLLAGCGKGGSETQARASGDCAAPSPALAQLPALPDKFPVPDKVTFTSTKMAGPSTIVEGYWDGDLTDAFNGWKAAFPAAGYTVTREEQEAADAEVNFDGSSTNGQVKLETECSARTHVKITIRPA
jgi:hypothetical protein